MRAHRLLSVLLSFAAVLAAAAPAMAADHNDPNAANSIFADIKMSATDLYDLFGFPADDSSQGERVVLALTFAPVPATGTLDPDLLYRLRMYPGVRVSSDLKEGEGLEGMLRYFDAVRDRYLHVKPAEVRVTPAGEGKAALAFTGFPGGDFNQTIDTNTSVTLKTPDGQNVQAYVGGRDDAFFNDLPGFFRSINYAPQFYHVPLEAPLALRELPIPKTLIELEGNTLFNFDPARPTHGSGLKLDLPPGPHTWSGTRFLKDAAGNFRFAYSGKDAQAGYNINAVILELPLSYISRSPQTERIVNAWGESWVRKASGKVPAIPDDRPLPGPFWQRHPWLSIFGALILGGVLIGFARRRRGFLPKLAYVAGGLFVVAGVGYLALVLSGRGPAGSRSETLHDAQLKEYKLVDTDGQAFADAALNERADERQLGADNISLGPSFVKRLAHLGWGFGPSIRALGLQSAFNDDGATVSQHRHEATLLGAFVRVKKVLFQPLNMPDNSWNKRNLNIPLRRSFEVFVPNVCAIDMDTTGTWPFGRRPEDQVATRFLSLFLDMSASINGKPYDIELLNQPALWQQVAIEPKTPPNPMANDKPFLTQFPYLAEPW